MARRDPDKIERIAVIGAGTIGASWAAYFLSRAMDVRVWDPDPHTETRLRALIARAWPSFERLGLAGGRARGRGLGVAPKHQRPEHTPKGGEDHAKNQQDEEHDHRADDGATHSGAHVLDQVA